MKKTTKSKSSQPAIGVEQDIVGLITTLVQKLVSLETKIDTVLGRLSERPVEVPRKSLSSVSPERHNTRPMYKVICADCGRHCEVPFRPSIGRAVYCKECFTKRRESGNPTPRVEAIPNETPSPHQPFPEKSPVKPSIAPEAKKKPSAKKTKKTKKKVAKK
jgi:CxxC-x17-CxxC domain-containing protein